MTLRTFVKAPSRDSYESPLPGEVVSLSRRTHAFASSLRVPSPYGKPSPLAARDFQQGLDLFSVAEASIVAARCAVYSTAFTVLLVQADRLEVEEDFRRTFTRLVLVSARSFSVAMRSRSCVIPLRQHTALEL